MLTVLPRTSIITLYGSGKYENRERIKTVNGSVATLCTLASVKKKTFVKKEKKKKRVWRRPHVLEFLPRTGLLNRILEYNQSQNLPFMQFGGCQMALKTEEKEEEEDSVPKSARRSSMKCPFVENPLEEYKCSRDRSCLEIFRGRELGHFCTIHALCHFCLGSANMAAGIVALFTVILLKFKRNYHQLHVSLASPLASCLKHQDTKRTLGNSL